jgi:hypothetical protein
MPDQNRFELEEYGYILLLRDRLVTEITDRDVEQFEMELLAGRPFGPIELFSVDSWEQLKDSLKTEDVIADHVVAALRELQKVFLDELARHRKAFVDHQPESRLVAALYRPLTEEQIDVLTSTVEEIIRTRIIMQRKYQVSPRYQHVAW